MFTLCLVVNWEGKMGGRLKSFPSLCCLVDEENSGMENTRESLKRKYHTFSPQAGQIFSVHMWAESLRRVEKYSLITIFPIFPAISCHFLTACL